jgi:hypothetical protein
VGNAEVFPDGYTIYRKDRNRNVGGVFLAIKDCYTSSAIPETDTNCEVIWARICIEGEKSMYVGSYYRPPNSNEESLAELRKSLDALPKNANSQHTHLAGDFNAPDIDWDRCSVGPSNKTKIYQEIIDLTQDQHLEQIQKEPTRENNILDLFFTNKPSLMKTSSVIPGISDHEMVVVDCDISPKLNKKKPRKIFKYKNADWDKIKESANKFNETFLEQPSFNNRSIDENWALFKNFIFKSMDKFIPSKMTTSRYNLPWLTTPLKRQIKKKQKLYNKARSSKSPEDWAKYKRHKKGTQSAIKKSHWTYVETILNQSFESNDTKSFWKYVKSRKQDNVGVSPIKANGKLHSDSKEKAELINAQFESVYTREDTTNIPQLKGKSYSKIDKLTITVPGVEKLLNQLKVNKATGPDAIPNRILKTCSSELAPALTAIFNQSMELGELPSDWRNANVAPLFKKGDRHQAVNYRPVSLTCVACKMLEHIVCKHILNHFDKFNILTILQHGFRKGYSCAMMITIRSILLFWILAKHLTLSPTNACWESWTFMGLMAQSLTGYLSSSLTGIRELLWTESIHLL